MPEQAANAADLPRDGQKRISRYGCSKDSLSPVLKQMCGSQGNKENSTMPEWEARFWSRVDRSSGAGACWPWRGAVNSHGYGNAWAEIEGERHCVEAHRLAYQLTNSPIPDGLHVMHSCNRPLCCNRDHLQLGTPSENIRAALRDGLSRRCLSGEAVREIVAARREGAMLIEIAGRFGVRLPIVESVLFGERWSWLTQLHRAASRNQSHDQLELKLKG